MEMPLNSQVFPVYPTSVFWMLLNHLKIKLKALKIVKVTFLDILGIN